MSWNPAAVHAQITEAIAYLQDVHGDPRVLDWWEDTGRHRTWIMPWTRIPAALRDAVADQLADTLEYLQAALDNFDTKDVAIAVMRLDRQVQQWAKGR